MKSEVLKRGLFLLVFLFLIGVVGAAHTASVTITPTSLLETNISNFSLFVINLPGGTAGIDNITLIMEGFIIIKAYDPIGLTWIHVNDSNNITWYGGELPVGFSGNFESRLEAKKVSSDTAFTWTIKTKDNAVIPQINTYPFSITTLNDNTPPVLGASIPLNDTFTNLLSYLFSLDVSDPETGIDKGDMSYASCGNSYTNQSMTCTNSNCATNLNIASYADNSKICYYFTVYNKGGSSNQSDIFLFNIDRSGPGFDLTDLIALNNTNDEDGILEFNFSISDDAGISNCFLYINNTLVNATLNANITYNMTSSNNQHSFYIQCNDTLNNFNQTQKYIIYHDKTSPVITNNQISVTYNSATITWNTNELANSLVNWDDNVGLTKIVSNGNNVTSHSLTINSLNETSLYYYQIFSVDVWGNPVNLSIMNFTTPTAPCTTCGGGGGGGGGGGNPACDINDWNCTEWSNCNSGGTYSRTCVKLNACNSATGYNPETSGSCMYYGASSEPTGNVQEITGGAGELNKTNEITGAFIGSGKTAIGYAILLILLLLILLGLYVIYDKYKYPQMDKRLIEKDLFLAQMDKQRKEEARIPKPFKQVSQRIAIPKPVIPTNPEKIKDVKDFMKSLKNGDFNKK